LPRKLKPENKYNKDTRKMTNIKDKGDNNKMKANKLFSTVGVMLIASSMGISGCSIMDKAGKSARKISSIATIIETAICNPNLPLALSPSRLSPVRILPKSSLIPINAKPIMVISPPMMCQFPKSTEKSDAIIVAVMNTAPPMVGVSCLYSCIGTYLLMGWFAFRAVAHAMYRGNRIIVRQNAKKKEMPARTEIYPSILMSKM